MFESYFEYTIGEETTHIKNTFKNLWQEQQAGHNLCLMLKTTVKLVDNQQRILQTWYSLSSRG